MNPVPIRRIRLVGVALMLDAMFVVLHILSQAVTVDGEPLIPSKEFINVDREISFPTWWAQTQVLAAAVVCLVLRVMRRDAPDRESRYWFALGVIFIYLSVDEGTQLHEGLISPMRDAFDISGGWFTFAWVIPFIALMAVFAVVFIRFWWRLPANPRAWIAAGGVCFVVGALFLEMAGGAYQTDHGVNRTLSYFHAAEEGFEMVGISLFVFGLLGLMRLWQPEGGVPFEVLDD